MPPVFTGFGFSRYQSHYLGVTAFGQSLQCSYNPRKNLESALRWGFLGGLLFSIFYMYFFLVFDEIF